MTTLSEDNVCVYELDGGSFARVFRPVSADRIAATLTEILTR